MKGVRFLGSEKMSICSPPEVLITEEELKAEEGEEGMNYYRGTVSGSILTVWLLCMGKQRSTGQTVQEEKVLHY